MVVGQIALSLMLLSAGGLFARGALKAAAANPGFSYDRQLLVAHRSHARAGPTRRAGAPATATVLARVRALPGVAAAAFAATVPFGDFHEGHSVERVGGRERGRTGRRVSTRHIAIIGTDYFRALNLPMVRGREFTAAEEDVAEGAAGGDRRRAPRAQLVRQPRIRSAR